MSETTSNVNLAPAALHAERGPSKWPAVLECAMFKSRPSNANTEKGSSVHRYFAEYNAALSAAKGVEAEAEKHVREPADFLESGARIVAREICRAALADGFQFDSSTVFVEKRVDLSPDVFGTVDLAIKSGSRLRVFDLKTFSSGGRDYRPQLAAYALGLLDGKTESIEIGTAWADVASICVETISADECRDYFAKAMDAFDARDNGKANPNQCGWCSLCVHCPTCPACTSLARTVAANGGKLAATIADWPTLSPAEKAHALVIADAVDVWARGVRDAGRASAIAGEPIKDDAKGIEYQIKTVKGRLSPVVDATWERMKARGVGRDEFSAALTLSASKATEIYKAHGLAAKDARAELEKTSTVGESTMTLQRIK